jgi:serine protease Do
MKLRIYIIPLLAAVGVTTVPAFSQAPRARAYNAQTTGTSYLGIGVVEVDPDHAKALNLKEVRGAAVSNVEENSPAARAGIKEGDVVLEYNGTPVEGVQQFIRLVRETPAGRSVKLVIWRNGATQDITATVGERQGGGFETPPSPIPFPGWGQFQYGQPGSAVPPIDIPEFQWPGQSAMLGIEGESLGNERQFADFFGVKDGVLVKQVVRNTPAEKGGLKAGDVITKVNGNAVRSTRDITAQLRSDSSNNRTVTLTIVRDKHEMPLTVTLDQNRGNPNPAQPPGQRF